MPRTIKRSSVRTAESTRNLAKPLIERSTAFKVGQPTIEVKEGKATTSSLQVAEFFGKDHSKILRDIKGILDQDTEANFGLSEYKDQSGKSNPMYTIDKDGFTLLAMGFTGAKAFKFKKDYIKAFNEMEQTIKEYSKPQTPTTQLEALKLASNQLNQAIQGWEIEIKAHKETKLELEHKQSILIEIAESVPAKTMRAKINEIIRNKAFGAYQSRWTSLYKNYKYRHNTDLETRAKNAKMTVLDYAEKNGYLEDLYNLAIALFETDNA